MLYTQPPGYYTNPTNRQTLTGLGAALGSPGQQSTPVTPGSSTQGAGYTLFNQVTPLAANSMPGSASYTRPSSMPQGPVMNQYLASPNRSTLLRVLAGRNVKGR